MSEITFVLRPEHIALLRASYVRWAPEAYEGYAAIDCKRPYGNSDVVGDIAKILGLDAPEDTEDWVLREPLLELHRQTSTALQILLLTGSFEPGVFVSDQWGSSRSWRRVEEGAVNP